MHDRIVKLQKALELQGVRAALLAWPRDIYYYAGTALPSYLIIPAQGEPVLLVTRDYERACSESRLPDNRNAPRFAAIKDALQSIDAYSSVIGLALDVLPTPVYQRLQELLPEARFVDITRWMRELRMVKDAHEIALIRRAAVNADAAQEFAMRLLAPGLTEIEATLQIELDMVRNGHDAYCLPRNLASVVRYAFVLSSESLYAGNSLPTVMPGQGCSPLVPYGPSRRKIAAGDIVVADLVGSIGGYVADEARTYVIGKPTSAQQSITDALTYIIAETMPLFKPGTLASDVFRAAQEASRRTPYAEHFLGGKERHIAFVGHGVGLELDELPMLAPGDDTVLSPGMVLAYEPIILARGIGAATLENTLLITETGHEVLTKRPVRLLEL